MIEVRVRYAGLPRSETGKVEEIRSVREGTSLGKLLESLTEQYGWQLDDGGRYIVIYNHHGISRDEWDDQDLSEGNIIQIISSIAGG